MKYDRWIEIFDEILTERLFKDSKFSSATSLTNLIKNAFSV